ncbi:ASKHA domain-containing protein [Nocardioides jensenii]|uniref:ASKHA domain-containing protein n=1 Tax=Nocardioides jensenii TaxID=1843 RepID=UPI000A872DA2|nr:ASKHA domain-containing protein [Nocardioides jensenii]
MTEVSGDPGVPDGQELPPDAEPPEVSVMEIQREGLLEARGADTQPHDGLGRVTLSFTVQTGPAAGTSDEAPASQRSVRVPPGVNVFDAASWNGIAIDSTCGGHGTCHKCKVQVEGSTPVTRHDVRTFTPAQLDEGWRLACLVPATRDLQVFVPPLTTRPKAATVGVGRQVILRPAVQKRYVELDEPTLADQRSDLVRLLDAITDLAPSPDLHVLRQLPGVLRAADFKVTAVIVDEALVAIEPGDTTDHRHAIAFDLGTTTVVATLLDLTTGTPVSVASMLNKQQPFGGDVISRISATMMDDRALERLQQAAGATLAELAEQVCREGGVPAESVYEVALAGNATMVALALGIDPEPIGVAPFVMTTALPPTVLAADLGLALHPRARAVMFPALGAYVGGDIVAGMLATGMDRDKRTRLFIDVGTNCEIVLSDGDTIVSTAAPAGPAFEGGAIRCGMRAAEGAIEVVRLHVDVDSTDPVELQVIGDVAPRGLCGSGLVDAVAELVRVGLLDDSGRFVPEDAAAEVAPGLADRLTRVGEERVFVLHRPAPDADPVDCVVLSQRDVRELQFAKAAISTGWSLLLDELGLEHRDVQQVLLAGSFGSYLSPAAAVRIGLVPPLPLLRIVSAGNVAGEGAKMALLSLAERAGAQTLVEEVTYVELSDRPDFNERFIEHLGFSRGS